MVPSLGRVVIYSLPAHEPPVNGAREVVAIIGQVFQDRGMVPSLVNLITFPPFEEPRWRGSVEQGEGPNTWRFPPRV